MAATAVVVVVGSGRERKGRMHRYLGERGSDLDSDPAGLVAGAEIILAAGRAPLVAFEGDIDNLAILLFSLPIVVVEGL